MRVLLVDPPYRMTYRPYVIPHMGLAYLAAMLLREKHEVRVVAEGLTKDPYRDFTRILPDFRPDLIAFSSPTSKIVQAAQMAQTAKELRPECRTLAGGWHASSVPDETARMFPSFDFVFAGEGENFILQLIDALDGRGSLDKIEGLAWRQDDDVVLNPLPAPLPDIKTLPHPAWELFGIEKSLPMYRKGKVLDYPIVSRRGCPFHCSFCDTPHVDRRTRLRDLDDFFDELNSALERWPINGIQFFDATFTPPTDFTMALCERMIAADLPKRLVWNCATRTDQVSYELLALMKKAGCRVIQAGVETGNEEVSRKINKNIIASKSLQFVSWCRDLGILTDISFIFGLPYDTRRTIGETVRFSRQLDPNWVSYFTFVPFPGTPAAMQAERQEANLRLLHKDYTRYEKQFLPPCELRDYSARRLFLRRMLSYAQFYLRPRKLRYLFVMIDPLALPKVLFNTLAVAISTALKKRKSKTREEGAIT